MNKELIDLQRNSKATCAIIKDSCFESLKPCVAIGAGVSDKFLYNCTCSYMDKIISQANRFPLSYFILRDFDKVSFDVQERFIGLIKNREIENYTLPNNCIVVLTVEDESTLKNISPEIYRFAVVAI